MQSIKEMSFWSFEFKNSSRPVLKRVVVIGRISVSEQMSAYAWIAARRPCLWLITVRVSLTTSSLVVLGCLKRVADETALVWLELVSMASEI